MERPCAASTTSGPADYIGQGSSRAAAAIQWRHQCLVCRGSRGECRVCRTVRNVSFRSEVGRSGRSFKWPHGRPHYDHYVGRSAVAAYFRHPGGGKTCH